MNDVAKLKAQMAQQMKDLGAKFIERTRGEIPAILAAIGRLQAGDGAAAKDLGYLVHRIHGGGATFGLDKLSEIAGRMEELIDPAVRGGETLTPQALQQVESLGKELESAANAAS